MIKIFGDSHAGYFNLTEKVRHSYPSLKEIKNRDYKLSVTHGASVKGLGKKSSRLNIAQAIGESISAGDTLVLNFGQVDLELGYYYENVIKCRTIEPPIFIEELVTAYERFLLQTIPKVGKIIIKGVNIPVFRFQTFAENYIGKIITENINSQSEVHQKKIQLSNAILKVEDATKAAIDFNSRMEEIACNNRGLVYFDINSYLADEEGLIKNEYIPANFDHHIVDTVYVRNIHWVELVKALEKV